MHNQTESPVQPTLRYFSLIKSICLHTHPLTQALMHASTYACHQSTLLLYLSHALTQTKLYITQLGGIGSGYRRKTRPPRMNRDIYLYIHYIYINVYHAIDRLVLDAFSLQSHDHIIPPTGSSPCSFYSVQTAFFFSIPPYSLQIA